VTFLRFDTGWESCRFSKVCLPGFERSYCGAPMVSSDGHRIGTLCALASPKLSNYSASALALPFAGPFMSLSKNV
jgi:hypothetical protein